MSPPSSVGLPNTDGRAARSAKTRDAVVRALLDLLEAGELRPTARRIAEHAGVSLRSVYVHFDDVEDLFVAAASEHRAKVIELVAVLPTTGPFEARLQAFTEQRGRVLEAIAPVRRASMLQEPFSPTLATVSNGARRMGRAEIARVFAIELDAIAGDVARRRVLDACESMSDADTWDNLRTRRGLDVDEAVQTVANALRLLLGAPAPPPAHARARRWRHRLPPAGGEERR